MGSKTKIVKGYVESDIRLDGKTAVITGCNTGVGYETALDFARRGARVLMACRDTKRAEDAKAKILQEVSGADLVVKTLDLSSLDSVRECARDINETESRLDILVNNAGVGMCPEWKTKEGFEMQFGVNHIGHFLFTNLLLDLMKKSAPSRIVLLSSSGHQYAKIDWNNLGREKNYNSLTSYANSKLANILHGVELSKRLEGTGVTSYSVHPGYVRTELQRHMKNLSHIPFFTRMFVKIMAVFMGSQISPKEGAQTTIYCAIAPELANVSGKYYEACAEKRPSAAAQKEADARKLWEMSEEWTKKPQETLEQNS